MHFLRVFLLFCEFQPAARRRSCTGRRSRRPGGPRAQGGGKEGWRPVKGQRIAITVITFSALLKDRKKTNVEMFAEKRIFKRDALQVPGAVSAPTRPPAPCAASYAAGLRCGERQETPAAAALGLLLLRRRRRGRLLLFRRRRPLRRRRWRPCSSGTFGTRGRCA